MSRANTDAGLLRGGGGGRNRHIAPGIPLPLCTSPAKFGCPSGESIAQAVMRRFQSTDQSLTASCASLNVCRASSDGFGVIRLTTTTAMNARMNPGSSS